jgi:hypothetical protein
MRCAAKGYAALQVMPGSGKVEARAHGVGVTGVEGGQQRGQLPLDALLTGACHPSLGPSLIGALPWA